MTTARGIIDRAHRLLGVVSSGDALPESNFQDGLVSLNAMLESWQTERLITYAYQDKTFTLEVGDATVTMGGTTPNIDTRPMRIENLFVRDATIDYPVQLVDQERWYAIPDKTVNSDIPSMAYYEPSYNQGILNLWPVPNKAVTLHVLMWALISSFASLATTVTLPPGYERALAYNLAVEIAPEHPVNLNPKVEKIAIESLANIKRANQRPMTAYTELGILTNYKSDIYSGGYIV